MSDNKLSNPALVKWSRVEPWLAAALVHDRRGLAIADVRRAYLEGRYLLLDGIESAALMESLPLDGGAMLHVFLAGGRMAELIDVMLPRVEAIARHTGHRGVVVMGRPGWSRVLAPHGYQYCGDNFMGEPMTAKHFPSTTFKDRREPMTAINFSLTPNYIGVATDTLATDARDWWPAYLTSKAMFLPHLDGLVTAAAFPLMMQDTYNFALTAPVSDVEGLAPLLQPICRRAFHQSMALVRSMHPQGEDLSWSQDGFLALFGKSERKRRLIGIRFSPQNDFAPELLADGVYTSPVFAHSPATIGAHNANLLCEITRAQSDQELRKSPANRNAIGGDVLLWELGACSDGAVASRVRRTHRFATREEDMAIIRERAAA